MKKILSLLLAMVMVLSLFSACGRDKESTVTPIETTQSTEPTVETTEREPIIPPLEEGADVLTFRYEQKWLDLYYEKLEEYKKVALETEDYSEVEALDPDIEELGDFLSDQMSIAQILYYCDMSDEEAEKRYLDMVDIMTEMSDKSTLMVQDLYKSDSKIKDELFADFTEEEIQELMSYDSEIAELTKRNEELRVEFEDLEDPTTDKKVGTLYAEIVKNNNRIAEIYGYDNYYDYAYASVYSRDYTGEEVEKMREYAVKYLVPLFEYVATSAVEKAYDMSSREAQEFTDFTTEDYDSVEYLDLYMEKLPEEVSADMQTMLDGNSVFPKSSDAFPGAFTTTISGNPFCYFSKDYRTTNTISHELGHYYSAIYADLHELPLDLAEVQSQGNEWLMTTAIKEDMKDDAYDFYLDYRTLNDMTTIILSLIIDEFEQEVYKTEGVEKFTAKDFDRIMKKVCENYGGYTFVKENLVDPLMYWRMVALEHPVYYISYAVSMIPAMDIRFIADEDWDQALNTYLGVTRDVDVEKTFLEVLDQAGLASPFDEKVYKALAEYYEMELEEEPQEAA